MLLYQENPDLWQTTALVLGDLFSPLDPGHIQLKSNSEGWANDYREAVVGSGTAFRYVG